jgi:small redox-active disulfide protein 2
MEIKILGTGCAKCEKLAEAAARAVEQAGVDAKITKVEKLDEIMAYGVAMTPALVIDDQVVSSGKVLDTAKIVSMITSRRH